MAEYFAERASEGGKDSVPSVRGDTSVVAASSAISKGRMGAVLVCNQANQMLGIITDGDIRRAVERGQLSLEANEIMTKDPLSLDDTALLRHAVETMKTRRINVLVVQCAAGDRRLVHIQDLLRLGL